MNSPLFLDCEQGSKVWFDARLGCVTSCRIAAVVKKRKKSSDGKTINDPLECTVDMLWELACELWTGKPTEHYVSRWMKEGKEKEPEARTEYERVNEVMSQTVGFAYHPTIKYAGCSPDGIIEDRGLIEIKCPKIDTHAQYWRKDVIPEEYLPQMIWQLACCPDFEWNDFVSYHPFAPEEQQIFQKRLYRDTREVQALIRGYELEVEHFNEKVQVEATALKARKREALHEVVA